MHRQNQKRKSRRRLGFPHPSRPGLGPTQTIIYTGYRFYFWGLKRPGCGVNHTPLPSAKVKERVELYLFFHFMACSRASFTFTVTAVCSAIHTKRIHHWALTGHDYCSSYKNNSKCILFAVIHLQRDVPSVLQWTDLLFRTLLCGEIPEDEPSYLPCLFCHKSR